MPDRAAACPHCGSDDETGWNRDIDCGELDLPQGYGREDDSDRTTRQGPSNAFAYFLVVVGALGIIALGGFRALASPSALMAAAAVVAGILLFLRRPRRS